MTENRIRDQLQLWLDKATADSDLIDELEKITDDQSMIEDAFYRNLAFGTGGLRGIIGAGTNRLNVYTVAKASQGLADYVIRHFETGKRSIAVSYDNRIKSDYFAEVASGVFAANGIDVFIYSELMPTPCLSFAVRHLNCSAGIMITASHNPSNYNGYKVYNADGCQITTEAAGEILTAIEKLDIFTDIKIMTFETGQELGMIQNIPNDVVTAYIEEVKQQSVLGSNDTIDKNVAIVYSPLNGTGLKPILRILNESGYTNITLVKEQEQPDGTFPTCPNPNPEVKETMELGIEYAKRIHAELILATDPDCDRVGIAVRNHTGDYELLSGNETGILLFDYICSRRTALKTMPNDPVMVKTLVTIDMAERIAAHYGVRTINVLTGFKFIGEQIGLLEAQGKADSYIFGFEESYGYLSGSYVRDKDGVNGTFLICEMFAFYKSQGVSLLDKLQELYKIYGYSLNSQSSFKFEGSVGFEKMKSIMSHFRQGSSCFNGKVIENYLDYSDGLEGLPKSDVLKFCLSDNMSIVIRPSGTESKLKVYISVSAKTKEQAQLDAAKIMVELRTIIN